MDHCTAEKCYFIKAVVAVESRGQGSLDPYSSPALSSSTHLSIFLTRSPDNHLGDFGTYIMDNVEKF